MQPSLCRLSRQNSRLPIFWQGSEVDTMVALAHIYASLKKWLAAPEIQVHAEPRLPEQAQVEDLIVRLALCDDRQELVSILARRLLSIPGITGDRVLLIDSYGRLHEAMHAGMLRGHAWSVPIALGDRHYGVLEVWGTPDAMDGELSCRQVSESAAHQVAYTLSQLAPVHRDGSGDERELEAHVFDRG